MVPLVTLLLAAAVGRRVPKCCRLDQVLERGGCVSLAGELPSRVRVDGGMVTFPWLLQHDMLREEAMPRCVQQEEVYPDFSETASSKQNGPRLTREGIFVHELRYFPPHAFCVEHSRQVADYEDYEYELGNQGDQGVEQQTGYITVMVCGELGRSMESCAGKGACPPRCCEPWQRLGADGRCAYSPSPASAYSPATAPASAYSPALAPAYSPAHASAPGPRHTSKPTCQLRPAASWSLEGGGLREGARLHSSARFCLEGDTALVCEEPEEPRVSAQEVIRDSGRGGGGRPAPLLGGLLAIVSTLLCTRQ